MFSSSDEINELKTVRKLLVEYHIKEKRKHYKYELDHSMAVDKLNDARSKMRAAWSELESFKDKR